MLIFTSPSEVFPMRMPVVLRYAQSNALTASANFAGNTFRLNSAFDPDQTGVGGQPNYFDTFAALYSKYRILWCNYSFTVTPRSGTGGIVAIGLSNSTTHTTIGSAENAIGLPMSKNIAFGGTGAPPARIQGRVRVGEIYGLTDDQVLADPNFTALINANIGNSVYCAVCVDTNGATDTLQLETLLEMAVIFEQRTYQAQS